MIETATDLKMCAGAANSRDSSKYRSLDKIPTLKLQVSSKSPKIATFCYVTIICLAMSITTAPTAVKAQGASHTCHMRELDLCAASLLTLVQNPNGLATSEQEINKQCVHLREADTCFRNYTRRCLTQMQRELVLFSLNSSLNGLLNDYCITNLSSRSNSTSALRSNYLKHAQCLNGVHKSGAIKSCLRELHGPLESLLAPNGEHGKRLQLACCAYRKIHSCLGGQVDKRCGKEAAAFVGSTMRRATSRLPDVMCRQYRPETLECKTLLAARVQTGPKSSKSSTSVVSRLLAAYSSL